MITIYRQLFIGFLLSVTLATNASTFDGLPYKSGFANIARLGGDISHFLNAEQKILLSPQPIGLNTDQAASVHLFSLSEEAKVLRGVWVSDGFVQLVNQIAHAEAIDRIERRFLERYMQSLIIGSQPEGLNPLPRCSNPRYWTDDMLNEQLSNFNSIVGIIVGIQLSHHCLGHYEKYQSRLVDAQGRNVPISTLLTQEEWDLAFSMGVQIALRAGCTIEGAVPLFEALAKMRRQPEWASDIFPPHGDFGRMKKEMKRIQKKFFYEG